MKNQIETLWMGIDGGGSGCRARLENDQGEVLGFGEGGAAGLSLGAERSSNAIMQAARAAYANANISLSAVHRTNVGIGLAGLEMGTAAVKELKARLSFPVCHLSGDAEIACFGAHGSDDGGIIIVGTGARAFGILGDKTTSLAGWGFSLSDGGSGAILGHRAIRLATLALDGLVQMSPLLERLLIEFHRDPIALVNWAHTAIPRDWARFAPMVIEFADAGDVHAKNLMSQSADEVEMLIQGLLRFGNKSISLVGGLSATYFKMLKSRYPDNLVEARGDPMQGAIQLAHGRKVALRC